jgi:hypothetical protein
LLGPIRPRAIGKGGGKRAIRERVNVGILMDEFRESRNLDIVRKLNRVIKVYFEKRNSGPAYIAKRNIIDYED